jgi:hypothetical protein
MIRLGCCAVAWVLLTILPTRAQTPAAPVAVVSVKSVDALLAEAKYLATLSGEEDRVKQVESFVTALLGQEGLDAVARTRPLGAFVRWPEKAKDLQSMSVPVIGFVPVADEKRFLVLLERVAGGPVRREEKLYRVPVPLLGALFVQFAHGHAFLASEAAFLRGEQLDPAAFLPPESRTSSLIASMRPDRLPADYAWFIDAVFESMWSSSAPRSAAPAKEQMPNLRDLADLDITGFVRIVFKTVLTEFVAQVGEVRLELGVDQKHHRLRGELALRPRTEKGGVADFCRYLGTARSRCAELCREAPLALVLSCPPGPFWKQVLGEAGKWHHAAKFIQLEPATRELARRALELLARTLETDGLDFGLYGRPEANGNGVCWVLGLKVQEGRRVDFVLRDYVRHLPLEDKEVYTIRWNHSRHAKARIHQWWQEDDENESYLAARDDVIFLALGEESLPALRGALDRFDSAATRPTPLCLIQGRLAPWLMDKEFAERVKKRVPAGLRDQVEFRMTLQGGTDLRLRVDMHSYVLRVAPLLLEDEEK